ncbi:Neurofibromin [Eumeta japonica]|uniref:Neurofibromin n=1 Tax=Eumeta variegata TaxID=151549 RepID=A0A4C1ZPY9_EUMVA|nr:Neurofibromin [Eumeta japonica]
MSSIRVRCRRPAGGLTSGSVRYFSLFMNLLNDCNEVEMAEGPGRLETLRNATIQAMSNLLSANIDSGLMHSIDLGYHRDLQTRAAFMEVLTKILQQGTEFDTLAETVLADRFEQLVQLVTMISDKGELPIAMALANVVSTSQMDELARGVRDTLRRQTSSGAVAVEYIL